MSLSDTVNSFGRDISTGFSPNGVCGFAPTENTYGFIDTSLSHDGSRGIAFLRGGLCVNLYGTVERMSYENITARLVESYESGYADELILSDGKKEIRVTDYSLNKPFLKLLVETLCLRCKQSALPLTEIPQTDSYNAPDVVYAEPEEPFPESDGNIYTAPEEPSPDTNVSIYAKPDELSSEPAGNIYTAPEEPSPDTDGSMYIAPDEPASAVNTYETSEELVPAKNTYAKPDEPAFKPAVPDGYIPPEIPEEKIEWISGADADEELSGEPSDALEGMSTAETLSFLVNSIREINTKPDEDETSKLDDLDDELSEIPPEDLRAASHVMPEYAAKASPVYDDETPSAAASREPFPVHDRQPAPAVQGENTTKAAAEKPSVTPPPVTPAFPQAPAAKRSAAPVFTREPPSDDVYLTASAKLREACESGKLSPETIDAEIKGQLIPAAKAFMEVIAAADVPKTLVPRIAELKAASAKIKDYFAIGEDVAARVMFFMLYQMLSYSDRIVEDAATKQRLNAFFKRCGPSGITLSMLDLWVRQR